MQHCSPSKIQPRIYLHVSHMPSPCCSFFKAMGSSLFPPVMVGGGNMEWMLWRMALDRCWSWAGLEHWVSWMKSSMYTSIKWRKFQTAVLSGFTSWSVGESKNVSNGCSGRDPGCCLVRDWLTSCAVSEAAQK